MDSKVIPIEEDVIRPSGQSHAFDLNLAAAYGIEEALIICHFQFWISYNKRKRKNFLDGKTWTYDTYNEIAENFPYLNREKVRRAINNLVNYGVLLKGNYNKMPSDPTNWFAFAREDIFVPDPPKQKPKPEPEPEETPPEKSENEDGGGVSKTTGGCRKRQGGVENDSAIPDTKPVANPDASYKTTTKPPPSSQNLVGGSFENEEKIKIYKCLENIDIPENAKKRYTEDFDEELVSKAVSYVNRPTVVIKKSLEHAIGYYIHNPTHMTETKEDREAKKLKDKEIQDQLVNTRRGYIQALRKEVWDQLREVGAQIEENSSMERVRLHARDGWIKEDLFYTAKNFKVLLESFLRKIGIVPPKFLNEIP